MMQAAISGISLTLALAIGLPCGAFLADPLRHGTKHSWQRVANVDELNLAGAPQRFSVMVPRCDAWTRMPDVNAGSVYLRRVPETSEIIALSAETSRMRLPVTFDKERQSFCGACWGLEFDLDGSAKVAKSASMAGRLRQYETKVIDGAILVYYDVSQLDRRRAEW